MSTDDKLWTMKQRFLMMDSLSNKNRPVIENYFEIKDSQSNDKLCFIHSEKIDCNFFLVTMIKNLRSKSYT